MDFSHCTVCPRVCGVDRRTRRGFCGEGARARVALVMLHRWEEPCLIGPDGRGAGTVFFAGCNLRCCYCQNSEISQEGRGDAVSDERLAEIFLEQEARGAACLDLVTPTIWTPAILRALTIARSRGLTLRVVWNTGGYERVETIEALGGVVDIFLPDLKYDSEESARTLSRAPHYPDIARRAIERMADVAGPIRFDDAGQMTGGVIIRHLVLPGHRHESMRLLDWIAERFGGAVQVSLMRQYTPLYRARSIKGMDRRLTTLEYESVVDHALDLGLTHTYVQEKSSADKAYVPVFDGSGVQKGSPAIGSDV